MSAFDYRSTTELIRSIDDDAAGKLAPVRINSAEHERVWLFNESIGSDNAENFFN